MYQLIKNLYCRYLLKKHLGVNTILFAISLVLYSTLMPARAQACCYADCHYSGNYSYSCCETAAECGDNPLCLVRNPIYCCNLYPNSRDCDPCYNNPDPCCKNKKDPCCIDPNSCECKKNKDSSGGI